MHFFHWHNNGELRTTFEWPTVGSGSTPDDGTTVTHSESPMVDTSGWTGGAESLSHRQMLDAVCYVVDNGVRWRSVPVDFPARDRVYAFPPGSGASSVDDGRICPG
jgi:hypothetical protein